MAGHAVGRVDLLAQGLQLVGRPLLVGIFRDRGRAGGDLRRGGGLRRGGLLLLHPGVVLRGGLGHHDDGHVAVLLAADLAALPAVDAGLVGLEPGVLHEARDAVLVDAQLRHVPAVDHVVGGDEQAHLLAHGHDHGVVHLEQVVGALLLALLLPFLDLRARGRQARVELHAVLEVVVLPGPLVGRHLDGEVGVGRVLHVEDGLGGRVGHADEDDERDDRPDHLDRRVLVEVGGLGPQALPVLEDRVEHRPEHDHEDDDAHPHDGPVQVVDLLRDGRGRRQDVHVVGGVRRGGCGTGGRGSGVSESFANHVEAHRVVRLRRLKSGSPAAGAPVPRPIRAACLR